MTVPDYFGITDIIKTLLAPAGFEDVHQDGMSWAKQGTSYANTTRVGDVDWNRILGQFRGLMNSPSVDMSDLPVGSNLILREFVQRFAAMKILAILSGTDVEGYGLLDKATYDPNDDGIIGLSNGGTGVAASSITDLRDQLGITAAITAAINALIAAAPGALDTLNELADALGDDPNFAATITAALALKAPLLSPTLTKPTLNEPTGRFLKGKLAGFKIENDTTDPTNDVVIGSGVAASIDDVPKLMAQPLSMIKRLDALWTAPGTNQGFLDQGTLGNGSYHVHAIERPDTGAVDYLASLSHDEKSVVTLSIASPGVVTWNDHGLKNGSTFKFSTTGSLPTGVTAGTLYYVIAAGLTQNSFQFAATNGGAAINTTGSQSGVHTAQSTPLLPTNYTHFRRIFTLRRISGAIQPFRHNGDEVKWVTPVLDRNSTALLAAGSLLNLSVPQGIRVWPLLVVRAATSASNIIHNIGDAVSAVADVRFLDANTSGSTSATPPPDFLTNTLGQLTYTVAGGGTITVGETSTYGYNDRRGQD